MGMTPWFGGGDLTFRAMSGTTTPSGLRQGN